MKFNLSRFIHHPYIKTNLSKCDFPLHLLKTFNKSYENLPLDPYISDETRKRRYANYEVKINKDSQINIIHTEKNTFKQNVRDTRKEERTFDLVENPYDPFLLHFITMGAQLTHDNHNHPIPRLSIDVHQVRQITYPGVKSHNSAEGIHQDGADYIVSACVLNRYNIYGGVSSIYTTEKEKIYRTLLHENDFIFQDDKNLYHYVTPIEYQSHDSIEPYGYRDIIGLDITIL